MDHIKSNINSGNIFLLRLIDGADSNSTHFSSDTYFKNTLIEGLSIDKLYKLIQRYVNPKSRYSQLGLNSDEGLLCAIFGKTFLANLAFICEKDAGRAYEEFYDSFNQDLQSAAKRNSAFLAICVSHLSPITWKKVLHRDNIPTVIQFRPDAAVAEKYFWRDVFTYEHLRGGKEFASVANEDLTNLIKEKGYLSGYFIDAEVLEGLKKDYFSPKEDFITKLHISILNMPKLDAKVAEGLRESIGIRY
jgi:hypothetical protein